jgi:antitoxin component of RelBE/YafQ-DinJ toxin-antitoxin module
MKISLSLERQNNMIGRDYVGRLENVVKQMLIPLKDIPFNLVIESLAGKKVIPFNFTSAEHQNVLGLLKRAASNAGKEVNKSGILRPRPNEVGNDIEPYVKSALNSLGLNADTPIGPKGHKKSTGYPDILFWFNKKPYYLECKTYNIEIIETTFHSFYFSPSDEFKVIYDAPHFILSFEIYVAGEQGTKHIYKCRHYKILSIECLSLDVKYEFNSDNRRMYSGKHGTIILAEDEIR